MKTWIYAAFFTLLGQQVLAQDTECAALWGAMTDAVPLQTAGADVTEIEGGLCEVALPDGQLAGLPVARLTYQLSDVGDLKKLNVMLEDVGFAQSLYQIQAEMVHDPVTGGDAQLVLRGNSLGGARFAVDATGTLAAFESASSAQTAFAGLKISELAADIIVTPELLSTLRVDLSDVSRSAMSDVLRGVSQTQIPDSSRREFLRFAGATPNAQGAVSTTMKSDRGLGVLQVATALANLPRNADDSAISEAIRQALDGVALTLAWKPGRR